MSNSENIQPGTSVHIARRNLVQAIVSASTESACKTKQISTYLESVPAKDEKRGILITAGTQQLKSISSGNRRGLNLSKSTQLRIVYCQSLFKTVLGEGITGSETVNACVG